MLELGCLYEEKRFAWFTVIDLESQDHDNSERLLVFWSLSLFLILSLPLCLSLPSMGGMLVSGTLSYAFTHFVSQLSITMAEYLKPLIIRKII